MKLEHLTPGTPQRVIVRVSNTPISSHSPPRLGWTTGEVREVEEIRRYTKGVRAGQKSQAIRYQVRINLDGSKTTEWRDIQRLQLAEVQEVAA